MSPRVSWPTNDPRPADVNIAISVLGNRTSVDILKFLRPRTSATVSAILKGTGILRPALSPQLVKLEEWDCISGDVPPGMRRGQNVSYSINLDRVDELMKAWKEYVFEAEPMIPKLTEREDS